MRYSLQHPVKRRALIAAVIPVCMIVRSASAAASDSIGEAFDVRGKVVARHVDNVRSLASGSPLMLKDSVETQEHSFARLELAGRTTVRLGSMARLLLDQYVAEAGGVLELGAGAMLFERAEDLPKIDISIRSRFGLMGVRGTRFFAGPSRGVFGVFVARGAVDVQAAGVSRRLAAGQGVNIAGEGQPPDMAKTWGKARIDEALASVGL